MLFSGNSFVHRAFTWTRRTTVFCGFGSAAALAAVAPLPLAVRDDWGAFVDERQARCWAVARPEADGRSGGDASATIFVLRGRGSPELQLRIARPARSATLSIDGRPVPLTGRGVLWWLAAGDDAAAVTAMRGGRTMQLNATGADGRRIRHRFRLAGAATAIDAAILGCAPRGTVANPPQ